MFQWTTTRIINSLTDLTSNKALVTADATKLAIKRSMTFEKNYITSVYMAPAKDPKMFSMTVNCSTALSKLQTLRGTNPTLSGTFSFYLSLEGSELSYYANDWYKKGRPFSIGFTVDANTSANDLATQIYENAKNYGIMFFGEKQFDIADPSTGTNLVITGEHEHQRFQRGAFLTDDGLIPVVADFYEDGKSSTASSFTLNERGTNGFGTYYQITKDLRLPTAQHTKAYRILDDETPIVGAKYTQFIITYCAPSMANPAFTVLGQKENSETTHIFWVKSDLVSTFLGYFTTLGVTVKQAGVAANGTAAETTAGSTTYTAGGTNYTAGTDNEPFTDDDQQA